MNPADKFKPGSIAVYSEDGYHLAVEVLADESNESQEAFKLRVLGILVRSPFCIAEVGEEFEPWQKREGFHAGRWFLRPIAKWANRSHEHADLARPYMRDS